MSNAPRRPLVRYHGGKWKLAPWIIGHFPKHKVYVEPFGGGGSVLLRKPRSYAEVYNDLDGEIVNLFRVARDNGAELQQKIELTPFARQEFEESYTQCSDPIEQARRTLVRSFLGFSSVSSSGTPTGFRANSNRSGTTPAHDWANFPKSLPSIIDRLNGVVIENRDAADVMRHHDSETTLHYVDPPYVTETRSGSSKDDGYRYEMTDDQHRALVEVLRGLKGAVIVSLYEHEIYDALGWQKAYKATHADGARDRTECLYLSPSATMTQSLFTEVA